MRPLVIDRLGDRGSTVEAILALRAEIDLDPSYQREGDIWDLSRKRLLIDSMLIGFDIPKMYFRTFVPRIMDGARPVRYAVIDGKQRLQTIIDFAEDRFSLGTEGQLDSYEAIPESIVNGITFSVLREKYPVVSRRFLSYKLDIVTIETDDLDVIEDMFLRLNEATPLNAAEKRNAYGGPVPELVRRLVNLDFFERCLPYDNRRYRYQDIATKFLYFSSRGGIADTKKVYLDRFTRQARLQNDPSLATDLWSDVTRVLDVLSTVFREDDMLLKAVGMSSVYFLLARQAIEEGWIDLLQRDRLMQFENRRLENRQYARANEGDAIYELIEFDRLSQSSNDAVALHYRCSLLQSWLRTGTLESFSSLDGFA